MREMFLLVFSIFHFALYSQTPDKVFNTNRYELSFGTTATKLKSTFGDKLVATPSVGLNMGCGYLINIFKWYSINTGVQVFVQKLNIMPKSDFDEYIDISSDGVYIFKLPVSLIRYYPINKKAGFYISAGISLQKAISSLQGLGYTKNDTIIYRAEVKIRRLPQIGFNFEVGGTYSLKNNSFFALGFNIGKYLGKDIIVDYDFLERETQNMVIGQFISSNIYAQIKLSYFFKMPKINLSDWFY